MMNRCYSEITFRDEKREYSVRFHRRDINDTRTNGIAFVRNDDRLRQASRSVPHLHRFFALMRLCRFRCRDNRQADRARATRYTTAPQPPIAP